jgi:hypothetical protein
MDKMVSYFYQPKNNKLVGDSPYWLVKNSWGTDWSDLAGYFKIVRGQGTCGINQAPTSAVV